MPIFDDDHSDYKKPRTILNDLLPQVHKSDLTKSIFENTFNRFLTKDDVKRVAGFIGQKDPNARALVNRQIQEPTPHRQAFQLQPVVYSKVGTVEHMASWLDILKELERLGVDRNKVNEWANAVQFNWVPPIDIDKIVRFQDYYWVYKDPTEIRPQYITIKSKCPSSLAFLNFIQSIIDEFGSTIPIQNVIPSSDTIVVTGNVTPNFEPGFVFFVKDSTNPDLNNTFFTVLSSSFNSPTNKTSIVVSADITSNIVDGVISFEELFIPALIRKQCDCDGAIGWDLQAWDDNPDAWHIDLINAISYQTEAQWMAAFAVIGPPFNVYWSGFGPNPGALWLDTTNDQLKQYDSANWVVIRNSFSILLTFITGTALWDHGTGCGETSVINAADQWIRQNRWIHKNDVIGFDKAIRAAMPIIEFLPNLELNEWTFTDIIWKYRSSKFVSYKDTNEAHPSLFELIPIETYTKVGDTLTFDPKYGDLTGTFIPGYKFLAFGLPNVFEVVRSRYQRASSTTLYRTVVDLVDASALTIQGLKPQKTSQGDLWQNYNEHWLYVEQKDTTPINHQPVNPYVEIPITNPFVATLDYDYSLSLYAERFIIKTDGLTTLLFDDPALREKALIGAQDIRVFVNGIRQYGTYDEVVNTVSKTTNFNSPPFISFTENVDFVKGITFFISPVDFSLNVGDDVLIEVGEPGIRDIGNFAVPVRTIEDNVAFTNIVSGGPEYISLIRYKKFEQVKTAVNQYPLFDMYKMNGETAFEISPIFSFLESQDAPIFAPISRRVVRDAATKDFSFQQHLIKEDNGPMFAYRDYDLHVDDFWFNPVNNQLSFWDGLTWTDRKDGGNILLSGFVGKLEPPSPGIDITGQYWFEIDEKEFKIGNYSTAMQRWTFTAQGDLDIQTSDPTIQSIWKCGLNLEEYIPSYVDRNRRKDGEVFKDQLGNDITVVLPIGDPDGEWEVPDQLFLNHLHENRVVLTLRELLPHFNDIIINQPNVPGFSGRKEQEWRFIPYQDVNYGLGGKIKEFNDGFDTLVSAVFNNNVTPLGILEFAQDRYENSLNDLKQIFFESSITYLTNVSPDFILNLSSNIINTVINSFEENDFLSFVFGDSPTFNDETNLGIRNFIATLVYIFVVRKIRPDINIDPELGIEEIVHHDGHRHSYSFSRMTTEGLITRLLRTPDPRTNDMNDVPQRTYGKKSTLLPPDTIAFHESATYFDWPILNGVYWYYTPSPLVRTLYRLEVALIGPAPPAQLYPDGTLWLDTTFGAEVLRIRSGLNWLVVPGNFPGDGKLHNGITVLDATISAWQPVNINVILSDIILAVENRLYDNSPDPFELAFDFDDLIALPANEVIFNDCLLDHFLDYAREREVGGDDPFSASGHYVATDPFTWNYKNFVPPALTPKGTPFIPGGDWRDLYEKAFGTPYPHLEPWRLQGYRDRPNWWYNRYLTTGLDAYGSRIWNYIHELTIATAVGTIYTVVGDFTSVFLPGEVFSTIDTSSVYQRWTVVSSSFALGQTSIDVGVPININATDIFIGMWENIRLGVIPPGETYSNEVVSITGNPITDATLNGLDTPFIPTFNYFCVNIGQTTLTFGALSFDPDNLFPPHIVMPTPAGDPIRTIFTTPASVIAPSADYNWMDAGPIEWEYRNASQFLYDKLKCAFIMQPMRLFNSIFGTEFYDVANLQVDRRTDNTFAHNRTRFHGDVINVNEVYNVNGMNQWYVNFNRFNGFDTTNSDFNIMWTGWVAPLTYQFGSFVDVLSIELQQRFINLIDADFNVSIKKSPGVEDFWLTSFKVTIINTPPSLARFGNEHEWVFLIDTPSPLNQDVVYYGVRQFQFFADTVTNVCTLYTYPIQAADVATDRFFVKGKQEEVFAPNRTFTVAGSTGNDGSYTVLNSAFDAVSNRTVISITGSVLSVVADGLITADFRSIPWETGQSIWFATNETTARPLKTNLEYFLIKISDNQFQVANTPSDATNGFPIDLLTTGGTLQYVGELRSTFRALSGRRVPDVWRIYEIDKDYIISARPPFQIRGIQNFISFIFGYDNFIADSGFKINHTKTLFDPDSGRSVDWQIEIERIIDFMFLVRDSRHVVRDRFPVTVNDVNDEWTLTAEIPPYVTGTRVRIYSSSVLPDPLIYGIDVYIIRLTNNTFKLAATQLDAFSGIPIDIIFTPNLGTMFITSGFNTTKFPTFEVNAFRNAIWFVHETGIVSDVVVGPVTDIRIEQLIFDQYGRQLVNNDLRILRQDRLTQITVAQEILNDIEGFRLTFNDPYSFVHMAGAHLFLDNYEHVLRFNNYTTEGCLVYDSFLGIHIQQFDILFDKNPYLTLRPNMGGFYLVKDYDKNNVNTFSGRLLRNIEASIDDMRFFFDSFKILEKRETTKHARALLDYKGTLDFLDQLDVNKKSQFLFYKGLLQYKGSNAAVKAFINSRKFLGASVDEFWAYKIAEFGSAYDQEFLEMYLTSRDSISNVTKFEFIENDTIVPDSGFNGISMLNRDRWFEQPEQLRAVSDDGQVMFFEATPEDTWNISDDLFVNGLKSGVDSRGSVLVSSIDIWEPARIDGKPLVFRTKVIATQDNYRLPFELPRPVIGHEAVLVFINGIKTIAGSDYLIQYPDRIKLLGAVDGSELEVIIYEADCSSKKLDTIPYTREITDGTNIVNVDFPLRDGVQVFLNGLKLTIGIDFTINGTNQLAMIGPQLVGQTLEIYGVSIANCHNRVVKMGLTLDGAYPLIRHNLKADTTIMLVDWKEEGFFYEVVPADIGGNFGRTITIPSYIPASGSITVFQNGVHLVAGVDYFEPNPSSANISADFITMLNIPSLPIKIVYDTARLVDGLHFEIMNSDIVRVFASNIFDAIRIKVIGLVPNKNAHNPSKVIDKISNTVISNIEVWDPARGNHYSRAINVVDIQNPDDPASYLRPFGISVTENAAPGFEPDGTTPIFLEGDNAWNTEEVGVVWMDTSRVDYIPYYDKKIFPNIDDRIRLWGRLADWSSIRLLEWTKSPVLPVDYGIFAAGQSLDTAVPDEDKLSGRSIETLFRVVAFEVLEEIKPIIDKFDALIEGTLVSSGTYSFDLVNIFPEVFEIGSIDLENSAFIIQRPSPTGNLAHLFAIQSSFNLVGSTGGVNDGLWKIISVESTDTETTIVSEKEISEFVVSVAAANIFPLIFSFILPEDLILTFFSGFIFEIVRSLDNEVKVFTVSSSTYDILNNETTVVVLEEVSIDDFGSLQSRRILHTPDPLGDIEYFQSLDIHVNGLLRHRSIIPKTKTIEVGGLREIDRVTFIQPIPTNRGFISAEINAERMTTDFYYCQTETIDDRVDAFVPSYYFWVTQKTLRNRREVTLQDAERDLTNIPVPNLIFQKPLPPKELEISGITYRLPFRYSQAVIKGLKGIVNDERRYIIRLTRDFTLRDTLEGGLSPLDLKNLHTEWEVFREKQPFHIRRDLWDRITESIVGFKLSDVSIQVPSQDRIVYDSIYNTDTRFGLGDNQAFVDGQLALASIIAYLEDPESEFTPIDINVFAENHNFDTPEAIIDTMNDIYNTFRFDNVNAMFFSVLNDSFSNKARFAEIFKTSWVAIHGIRLLEVNGIFN